MNKRKEMIPAPARTHKATLSGYCKPEWELLCNIRRKVKRMLDVKTAKKMHAHLRGIINHMDDTFNDWPEDPK